MVLVLYVVPCADVLSMCALWPHVARRFHRSMRACGLADAGQQDGSLRGKPKRWTLCAHGPPIRNCSRRHCAAGSVKPYGRGISRGATPQRTWLGSSWVGRWRESHRREDLHELHHAARRRHRHPAAVRLDECQTLHGAHAAACARGAKPDGRRCHEVSAISRCSLCPSSVGVAPCSRLQGSSGSNTERIQPGSSGHGGTQSRTTTPLVCFTERSSERSAAPVERPRRVERPRDGFAPPYGRADRPDHDRSVQNASLYPHCRSHERSTLAGLGRSSWTHNPLASGHMSHDNPLPRSCGVPPPPPPLVSHPRVQASGCSLQECLASKPELGERLALGAVHTAQHGEAQWGGPRHRVLQAEQRRRPAEHLSATTKKQTARRVRRGEVRSVCAQVDATSDEAATSAVAAAGVRDRHDGDGRPRRTRGAHHSPVGSALL
jgi:hypothetical protein